MCVCFKWQKLLYPFFTSHTFVFQLILINVKINAKTVHKADFF